MILLIGPTLNYSRDSLTGGTHEDPLTSGLYGSGPQRIHDIGSANDMWACKRWAVKIRRVNYTNGL